MNEKFARRQTRKTLKVSDSNRTHILIVCEEEKTEPNYFRSFNIKKHTTIVIRGEGMNTISLVNQAIKFAKLQAKEAQIEFDEIWVIFDKDDFLADAFNQAILNCKTELINKKSVKINAAWSNQAFELWYCLHYDYINHTTQREEYITRLNEKFTYEKNMENIRQRLKDSDGNEVKAIARAKKLYQQWAGQTDYHNPCTTVYKLVEKLRSMEIK